MTMFKTRILCNEHLFHTQVVEVKVQAMTLLFEERLLFKLLQSAGLGGKGVGSGDDEDDEIMNMLTQRSLLWLSQSMIASVFRTEIES